jgi:hypothetical protein
MMNQTSGIPLNLQFNFKKLPQKINDDMCLMVKLISIAHWLIYQTHTRNSGVEIFQFMTAVLMNAQVIWDAPPRRLVSSYRRFGRVFCLHLQGLSVHLLGLRYAVGGGSTFLRSVGNYLPVDMAWQPRNWILKTKFTVHLLVSWRYVDIRSMWNCSDWLRNKWTAWCHGDWCHRPSHEMGITRN